MNPHSPGPRAELLTVEGPDALAFAQAQLSSDVRALQDRQWQWSAWLDVRGRVRALLQLARVDATHLQALLRGGSAKVVAAALQPYVMRSAVTLQAQDPGLLHAGSALPAHAFEQSTARAVFGCGEYSLCATAGTSPDTDDVSQAWRLSAIRAGHPWLPDAAVGAFVPQALSLERLAAVSFAKGCFPGQEIAARLHYRGGHKKHLCRLTGPQAMHGGDALRHDDADVGMLLDAAHVGGDVYEALAVLRDDIATMSAPRLQCAEGAPHILRVAQMFAA